MVRVNIELTASKVFVFYAFTIISVYSFVFKDPMPITTSIPSLAALFGAKIYKEMRLGNNNNKRRD